MSKGKGTLPPQEARPCSSHVRVVRWAPKSHPYPSCAKHGHRKRSLHRRIHSLAYCQVACTDIHYADYKASFPCYKYFRNWPLDAEGETRPSPCGNTVGPDGRGGRLERGNAGTAPRQLAGSEAEGRARCRLQPVKSQCRGYLPSDSGVRDLLGSSTLDKNPPGLTAAATSAQAEGRGPRSAG